MMNKLFTDVFDRNNKTPFKTKVYNGFFEPYKSATEVASELCGPVTTPVMYAVFGAYFAALATAHAVRALTDLLLTTTVEAGKDFNLAGMMTFGVIMAAVVTVLSPLIAAITFLTRLASTAYDALPSMHAESEQINAPAVAAPGRV